MTESHHSRSAPLLAGYKASDVIWLTHSWRDWLTDRTVLLTVDSGYQDLIGKKALQDSANFERLTRCYVDFAKAAASLDRLLWRVLIWKYASRSSLGWTWRTIGKQMNLSGTEARLTCESAVLELIRMTDEENPDDWFREWKRKRLAAR